MWEPAWTREKQRQESTTNGGGEGEVQQGRMAPELGNDTRWLSNYGPAQANSLSFIEKLNQEEQVVLQINVQQLF